ncbi:MAG TPA: hypothetical protein VFY16_03695, partial [Gemmatimonadaceae bacterium]|nr:hypothetical protein [Gemmatimonadaceae bacterium]
MLQTVPTTTTEPGFAETFQRSAGSALGTIAAAVPRGLAFLAILIVGWFVASLIAKGVAALLRAVNFNQLAERSGIAGFVEKMGVQQDSTGVIALVAKWFVRLITLVVAFDALGLPAVSQVLQQLLLWLPNLVVALIVLVIGGLAAGALSRLVRGSAAEAGFTNPDLLATIAKVGVMAFAVVIAVNQLGIAQTLINTLLVGVIGALALAAGLAFGLGGRDVASRMVERAYASGQGRGGQAQAAAQAARQRAQGGRGWADMPADLGIARAEDATQRPPMG